MIVDENSRTHKKVLISFHFIFSLMATSLDAQLDKKEMLRYLDILGYFDNLSIPNDLKIIKNGGGSDLIPVYFVAKSGDDLYICTRGATDANDFRIVLEIDNVDYLDGRAHKGILNAAHTIVNQLENEIKETKGTIHVLGHSLGSATSVGISVILRLEKGMENVKCYNFAQFPVFSKQIADKTRSWMTTVIYGSDIVPKLTNKNVGRLLNTMAPPGPQQEQGIQSLKQMVQGMMINIVQGQGVTDQNQLIAVQNVLSEKLDKLVSMSLINDYSLTPVLCGTLYHILPHTNLETKVTTYNVIPYNENLGLDLFGMMMGVQQHYIRFYRQILHQIYDQKQEEPKPAPSGPVMDEDLD